MNKFWNMALFLSPKPKIRLMSNVFLQSNLTKQGEIHNYFRFVHTTQKLLTEDNQTQQNSLVYEGPLRKKIKLVKILSLSSSMVSFAILPVVIKDLCQVNLFLGLGGGLISSAFLSTPLLLDWITKRYVIELYYHSETKLFTAKTFNLLSQIKEIKYSASDVYVPDLPGMLCSFHVKDRQLFVDSRIVLDPEAFSHMMGYDKPLDLKLDIEEKKDDIKAS